MTSVADLKSKIQNKIQTRIYVKVSVGNIREQSSYFHGTGKGVIERVHTRCIDTG